MGKSRHTRKPVVVVGLAARVRAAAATLGTFAAADLGHALGVQTRKDLVPIRKAVEDALKRGEIKRVCRGRYEYQGRQASRTYLDKIWHLVRSHRHFTTDDIERLSGAARNTVTEYLGCLAAYGFLARSGRSRWRLVKDPGPNTPVNTAKCKRLKEIRLASGQRRNS